MYYITVRFTAVCQTYNVSVSRDNLIVRSSMTIKVFIDFAFLQFKVLLRSDFSRLNVQDNIRC